MSDDARDLSEAEAVLQAQQLMLRGYARHLVSSADDAEDLAQEVCLEVLKNPLILLRGDDSGAYLRGIARHLASRHHRRIQRNAVLEELIDLAWQANGAAPQSEVELQKPDVTIAGEHNALQACLQQMPQKTRGMIRMRYDDGMNSTEIAARMSTSSDAIRMALGRARLALAKCVKQRLAVSGDA